MVALIIKASGLNGTEFSIRGDGAVSLSGSLTVTGPVTLRGGVYTLDLFQASAGVSVSSGGLKVRLSLFWCNSNLAFCSSCLMGHVLCRFLMAPVQF